VATQPGGVVRRRVRLEESWDKMAIEDKKRTVHRAMVKRILEGDGRASRAQRCAAFDNAVVGEPLHTLIGKVASQPTRIADEDFAAVKASGLNEDEIFELVVCAALGQATRQYETALEALTEAVTDKNGE
jgi:hypothetical protein